MKDRKPPVTVHQVEEFFEELSEEQVRQFLERVLKGKKPKKTATEPPQTPLT